MPLTPGYGDTPLPDEELEALLPHIAEHFEEPVSKAAICDLEQGVQEQVTEELLTAVLDGTVGLDDLVNDFFLRDLHAGLYGDIWTWAGVWRRHELNIGVAPEQVAVELRNSLDTIRYRWEHTTDWTARELGIAVHAEAVRVHACLAVIVSQHVGIGLQEGSDVRVTDTLAHHFRADAGSQQRRERRQRRARYAGGQRRCRRYRRSPPRRIRTRREGLAPGVGPRIPI